MIFLLIFQGGSCFARDVDTEVTPPVSLPGLTIPPPSLLKIMR